MDQRLTLELYDPRNTPAHRCGLGGLACLLHWLEIPPEYGAVKPAIPGEWTVEKESIRLRFDDPLDFLKSLYEAAFGVRDGLLYTPAALAEQEKTPWNCRRLFQESVFNSILQSNKVPHRQYLMGPPPPPDPNKKTRKTAKPRKTRKAKPAGEEVKVFRQTSFVQDGETITVSHDVLLGFTHQTAYKNFFYSDKFDPDRPVAIKSFHVPGFVSRHPGSNYHSIEQAFPQAFPLHFFLLGAPCFALARNTSLREYDIHSDKTKYESGTCLVVPDVADLAKYARNRPVLHGADPACYRVYGLGDATIRCYKALGDSAAGLGVYFMDIAMWNPKQKVRVRSLDVQYQNLNEPLRLATAFWDRFSQRWSVAQSKGQNAKNDNSVNHTKWYSHVIALIHNNFALGRPWWSDFRRLVPDYSAFHFLRSLSFQPLKETILMMIDDANQEDPETILIRSIHELINLRYSALRAQQRDRRLSDIQFWKNLNHDLQMIYLDLKHAGNPDLLRDAINRLIGHGVIDGCNASQNGPPRRIRLLQNFYEPGLRRLIGNPDRWREVQGLALAALATYDPPKRKKKDQDDNQDSEVPETALSSH